MPTPLRLIIADDHALFRQGLKSLLLLQPDTEVVAEIESANDVQPMVSRTDCNVLLLDLQMDRWMMEDDTEAIALIKQQTGFDYAPDWDRQRQTRYWLRGQVSEPGFIDDMWKKYR